MNKKIFIYLKNKDIHKKIKKKIKKSLHTKNGFPFIKLISTTLHSLILLFLDNFKLNLH